MLDSQGQPRAASKTEGVASSEIAQPSGDGGPLFAVNNATGTQQGQTCDKNPNTAKRLSLEVSVCRPFITTSIECEVGTSHFMSFSWS